MHVELTGRPLQCQCCCALVSLAQDRCSGKLTLLSPLFLQLVHKLEVMVRGEEANLCGMGVGISVEVTYTTSVLTLQFILSGAPTV